MSRNARIVVNLPDGYSAMFQGDVEFLEVDGVLSVYDYGLREEDPNFNGLVFAASKGFWMTVACTTIKPENNGNTKA